MKREHLEKHLALASHLGLDTFTYNDPNGLNEIYVGMSQDEFDRKEQAFLMLYDTREETDEAIRELIGDMSLLEDEFTVSNYDDSRFEYGNQEYLVCTDSEADDAWSESIDQYIDDCVICELPEQYRQYFDSEKFKSDCSFDGRGHTLSGYDGHENEETIDMTTYYIYRTN